MTLNRKNYTVFYGWWIVGVLFLMSAYVSGVIFYGFTAAFEPIANEFGWSYAQVSFAASLRGLETGLMAPLAGFLVDRWNSRRLLFAGAIITGLGLFFLSRVTSLMTFYFACAVLAIGMSASLGVIPMTVVGNWFRRKVSIATGIVVSAAGVGGLMVSLITLLIDKFEWRAAMAILGVSAWIILIPLSLLVRHKPEQYGYLPDGDASNEAVSGKGLTLTQSSDINIRVGQAIGSRTFWHISLGLTCHALVIHAVLTHVMPYLSSIGIARSTSSLVASAIPVVSISGRLGFGWLGDRFDNRRLAAAGLILTSLSLLCFGYIANTGVWLLVPFIILVGIGYGGTVPMILALTRGYFGRARLGTILGIAYGISLVGSIAGPPLAGWVFDSYGSYQYAWFAFIGITLAGAVVFMATPSKFTHN